MDELPLLAEYADCGSSEAFRALVDQYIDLVYTSARRQVRDAHLAEDVTQAVFIVLHRKAKSIPRDRPLSAWLLKTTSYTAANARRLRARRHDYERKAAEMAADTSRSQDHNDGFEELAPMLDAGLARLRAADRDALLLKFFEKKSLREIGEALGVSEEAAAKRVQRALDRLRDYFQRHGAPVTSVALGLHLAQHAIHLAPAGLSQTVASAAMAGGSAGGSGALLAKKLVTLMTIKKSAAIAGVCLFVLAGAGGAIVATRTLFSSPKVHDVTIDLPKSPWTATFSDGTAVQVLGLSEFGSKAAANWWNPDGSKADAPENPFTFSGNFDDPHFKTYIARFSFYGQDVSDKGFVCAFASDQGCIQNWHNDSLSTGEAVCIVHLPADAKQDDLKLGLGRGEYTPLVDIPLSGDTTQPAIPASNGTKVQLLGIADEKGGVVIDIGEAFDHPLRRHERDEEIVAIVGGRVQRPTSRQWTGISHLRLRFAARRNEISKLIYRTRPLEWATVSNVSLTPQVRTDARVKSPGGK